MHSIVLSWFYNIATIRPNQSLEGGKYLGNFVMVFFFAEEHRIALLRLCNHSRNFVSA